MRIMSFHLWEPMENLNKISTLRRLDRILLEMSQSLKENTIRLIFLRLILRTQLSQEQPQEKTQYILRVLVKLSLLIKQRLLKEEVDWCIREVKEENPQPLNQELYWLGHLRELEMVELSLEDSDSDNRLKTFKQAILLG